MEHIWQLQQWENHGLESNIRLQHIYGEDVKKVDEIYNELISKDRQSPTCNITHTINNDGTILYKFEFNEAVKNFEKSAVKLYTGSIVDNKIASTVTLSTSSPAYSFNVLQNKKYVISFDYKCISNSQEFEIGLYSDTINNLPTKKITSKTQIQHEDYIIDVKNADVQFKILSKIQENNNVTLSNIQIIEINDEEIEKQEFEKINNAIYTLKAQYNESFKYVIILNEGVCTDFNENKNKECIKIIKWINAWKLLSILLIRF